MTYRIDGKIDGHENTLFTAALYLTELIWWNKDLVVAQMRTPVVRSTYDQLSKASKEKGVSSGIVISAEKVRELHSVMQQAFDKLKQMEKRKETYLFHKVKINEAVKVLDHVVKDIGLAAKKGGSLQFVNPMADKPDQRFLPGVNKLLERFGVSSSGGRMAILPQGRVVEYFDQGKKDLLVIYIMDAEHTVAAKQRVVRNDILALTGVPIAAIEAQSGDYNFTEQKNKAITLPDREAVLYPASCTSDGKRHIQAIDERNIAIPAGVAVECLMASAIDTFGSQSSDYLEQDEAARALQKGITGFSKLSDAYVDTMELLGFFNYKGEDSVKNTVGHLREKNGELEHRVAILIYGTDHYFNIVEKLKEEGVNFLVVSYSS